MHILCNNKSILSKNILPRETILLESLLTPNDKKEYEKNKIEEKEENDTLKLEIDNIIEEYLLMKSFDEIKVFIEKRCSNNKIKFSECILDKYFLSNKRISNEIYELLKKLIKNNLLDNNSISKSISIISNNWDERKVDYINPTERMISLINNLKNNGIKNLNMMEVGFILIRSNEKTICNNYSRHNVSR
jgi:hypothetical protein